MTLEIRTDPGPQKRTQTHCQKITRKLNEQINFYLKCMVPPKVIVRFVDIGKIVDLPSLNFLFIHLNK
jgi:hypothetical protein